MNAFCFHFDLNLCVGCEACVIACTVENALPPGQSWRRILTFNPEHQPQLPTFHLSLACQHCASPACVQQCPAHAVHKDPVTGAVLLEAEKCLGCRLCQWVCPFDAPQYNRRNGVIEKCSFCHDRLIHQELPACARLCPTGALQVMPISQCSGESSAPGFPDSRLQPAVTFTNLKPGRGQPEISPRPNNTRHASVSRTQPPAPVSPADEWPLVLFTWLTAVLVGTFSAHVTAGTPLRAATFFAAGAIGLAVSTLHLGRPGRAIRALANWRRSWLSREIIGFTVFWLVGTLALLDGAPKTLGMGAALAGWGCLLTIDCLYASLPTRTPAKFHSAQTTFIAVTLFAMLTQTTWLLVAAFAGRVGLYAKRKRESTDASAWPKTALTRVGGGFLLPGVLWFVNAWAPLAVAAITIGDALDRWEFYGELDPESPTRCLHELLHDPRLENTIAD